MSVDLRVPIRRDLGPRGPADREGELDAVCAALGIRRAELDALLSATPAGDLEAARRSALELNRRAFRRWLADNPF